MNITDKIYNDLLNKIHNGFYKVGDLLPTESNLIEKFGVSRTPVRDALTRLKDEGYILRKPRIGSEVISNKRVLDTSSFKGGFSKYFGISNNAISTKTIEISTIYNNLDKVFEDDEELVKISRIRTVNNVPVFFIRSHYPKRLLEDVNFDEFEDIYNLREWIQDRTGTKFSYTNEKLYAVQPSTIVRNLLDISNEKSVLRIERFTYDNTYKLVEYVEYFVNTDIWNYEIDYEF